MQEHLSIWERLVVKLSYRRWLGFLTRNLQRRDDFDWRTYTKHYVGVPAAAPGYTVRLSTVDFKVSDGRIVLPVGKLPLHSNHRLIYETALKLKANSAFEFGFGGGYHLANLRALFPDGSLGGVDVSEQQREFAMHECGTVFNDARRPIWNEIRDMTVAGAAAGLDGRADLVYCQAVLMHIHGGDRPETFLRNMWAVSRRYILLVENWRRHDFVKMLRRVFPGSRLYLVSCEGQRGILIDRENTSNYPVVESDAEMREVS